MKTSVMFFKAVAQYVPLFASEAWFVTPTYTRHWETYTTRLYDILLGKNPGISHMEYGFTRLLDQLWRCMDWGLLRIIFIGGIIMFPIKLRHGQSTISAW